VQQSNKHSYAIKAAASLLGAGTERPCQPGDIALLAPTGADLWRYEEALERRSIPVATQASKGLFRRQEVQDLIALTRVLADRRDTLALGALLRGPLVGLSEDEGVGSGSDHHFAKLLHFAALEVTRLVPQAPSVRHRSPVAKLTPIGVVGTPSGP